MAEEDQIQQDDSSGDSLNMSHDQLMQLLNHIADQRKPQQSPQSSPFQKIQQPVPANVPQAGKTLDQASGAYIRPDTAASLAKFRQQGDQLQQQDQQKQQQAENDPAMLQRQMAMRWAADFHRLNPTASPQEVMDMAEKAKGLGFFGTDPSKGLENQLKQSEIDKNKKYTDLMGTTGAKGGGQAQYIISQYENIVNPETGEKFTPAEAMEAYKGVKRAGATEAGGVESAKETAKKEADIKAAAPEKEQEKIGEARGTAQVDYAKVQAGMPRLKDAVSTLSNLSSTANYTMAQDALASVRRQFNLPVGQGAIDASHYESLINNILLPQLRTMFGARVTNFDVTTATKIMGNPKLSPAEKQVQLDTYIQQAMGIEDSDYRNILNLGGKASPPQDSAPAKGVQKVINYSDWK
jgi:hypothetical protein